MRETPPEGHRLTRGRRARAASGQQAFGKLLVKDTVARDGKMIVADNVETLVPVLVAVGDGEVGRKQVDERLAAGGTEISPNPDLPAVAIVLRDLLGPGIDHDGQRDAAARQQI